MIRRVTHKPYKGIPLAAALVAAMASSAAIAQSDTSGLADLSQLGLSRSQVEALNAQLTAPAAAPGIAFGSPVAFGTGFGQAFFAVGGQTQPSTYPNDYDGSATLGVGLGNPFLYAGLEVTATAISVYEGFAEDGNVNFKLHRVLPGRSGIAIGVDNTSRWGNARGTDSSTYGAFTKVMDLAPDSPKHAWPLAITVGAGDGRFVDPGEDGIGVFGAVAIQPFRQVSVIVDYTGRDTNAALSLVPFARLPVVVTAGAVNLGERFLRREFAGGVGVLFNFK
jgi:hypothetical protein